MATPPVEVGEAGDSSVSSVTLMLMAGVTDGSPHAKLHMFFTILWLGHGSRLAHNSSKRARLSADRLCRGQELV